MKSSQTKYIIPNRKENVKREAEFFSKNNQPDNQEKPIFQNPSSANHDQQDPVSGQSRSKCLAHFSLPQKCAGKFRYSLKPKEIQTGDEKFSNGTQWHPKGRFRA